MRTLLALCLTLTTGILSGQISFSSSQAQITTGFRSGAPVASIDMNGDGLDDLVRLDAGVELYVDLQGADASFHNTYQGMIPDYVKWNLIAGDINNDGWPDIMTSGSALDEVNVLKAIPYTGDYQASLITDSSFFAQGANLADADGDGFPDLFVCNDDGLNRLYINDGTGDFERNDTLIDFTTTPPSDNSGNYGSVWVDFDLDNDLDLYISKCRAGVTDPADPRRINALYVKTDTGYVEMADSFGLAFGDQSWCSDFADIDNDGDFDLIVVNHFSASILLENTGGGNYSDISLAAGISLGNGTIQSVFTDFDNDGYVDLLVSGNHSKLFHNQGDNTFAEIAVPFGGEDLGSFTIGDFNGDGFPDVYGVYNQIYNIPSTVHDDTLWLNNGNDNNYLRIKAIGINNNPNAIGAKLYLHAGGVDQIREIRAGESYGIGTSLIKIFGLAGATIVDSLTIVWPNGDTQTHYDVAVNTTVTVEQGGCLTEVESLGQGPFVQCGSDTFAINAPGGYDSYLWSNGDTTQSIEVTEPGLYHVSLTDTGGCLAITGPVTVWPCVWPSDIVYVDSSATGSNTGYDWPNACTDLRQAIELADSFSVGAIWVAGGTYYPTSGSDRSASFVLADSVKIYGGFEGNETELGARDVLLNPTRLSGDIGVTEDISDNSFHVVVCPDSIAEVRLDGFIIRDGNASGGVEEQTHGAGVYCAGKMSLYNVVLTACCGTGAGVYLYNSGISAELRLNNCQLPETLPIGISNVNNAKIIVEGVNEVGY